MRILVFLIAALAVLVPATRAAEPFFKPGDVVAVVGGEDMVVAAELGYLETLIQLALPDHKLKFRSLAREGDTVFEQRRDLNYPKLEDQLDKIGATVVICQFGQMESLAAARAIDGMDRVDAMDKVDAPAGDSAVQEVHKVQPVQEKADALRKAKVAEFVAAYEKLIGRLKGKDGARRIIITGPHGVNIAKGGKDAESDPSTRNSRLYHDQTARLARERGCLFLKALAVEHLTDFSDSMAQNGHLSESSHRVWAQETVSEIYVAAPTRNTREPFGPKPETIESIRALIAAKNRLWFHYYRPQNWAFLAGDRTNQPSSRDHIDRNKRWFPEELEKFVPLIDAKDAEIWALAKKLSQ